MPVLSLPPLFSGAFALVLANFVFLKNPRSPVNRAFALLCFETFFWQACWFATYFLQEPFQKDLIIRIAWTAVVFIPFTYYEFAVRFLALQEELPWVRRAYVFAAFFLLLTWTTDLFIRGYQSFWWGYYTKAGPWHPFYLVVVLGVMLRAIVLLKRAANDRSLTPDERGRRRLVFLAFSIYFFAACEYAIGYGVPLYPIGVIVMPAAFCVSSYAIIRHQFMDITIVIRKSLVYSLLIACITATYLVMVIIMERWFQGFFGYRSLFATVFVAFLIAIFFNPLRGRIQGIVDRALFKATPAELAAQREQLLTEVRKTDQMKAVATLAAGLAHEIKNPLASIKTFIEHLETRYNDPTFRGKFRKIVGGEVKRINHIVQELLEFAKPTPAKLRPIEVSRLLDETLELLNSELVERHLEVRRHYEARPQILGDPQQLKQAFLNLLLNSLESLNGSGTLDLRTAIDGDEFVVTVADNGVGIAPNDLPHVFEPFFTTRTTGTGLGLAVVQGIIKEHGGTIQIESHVGRGTTVSIALPARRRTERQCLGLDTPGEKAVKTHGITV